MTEEFLILQRKKIKITQPLIVCMKFQVSSSAQIQIVIRPESQTDGSNTSEMMKSLLLMKAQCRVQARVCMPT